MMSTDKRVLFQGAADKQWKSWRTVARRISCRRPRRPCLLLTDMKDGLRSDFNKLPIEPSVGLVVPGLKDRANLENELRRDAPTGPRNAQQIIFVYGGSNPLWIMASGDVRAAFLKGDPYMSRKLYIVPPNEARGPKVEMPKECLARVLKGAFGLAAAPHNWYLRLRRCMKEHKMGLSCIDLAFWCLRLAGP